MHFFSLHWNSHGPHPHLNNRIASSPFDTLNFSHLSSLVRTQLSLFLPIRGQSATPTSPSSPPPPNSALPPIALSPQLHFARLLYAPSPSRRLSRQSRFIPTASVFITSLVRVRSISQTLLFRSRPADGMKEENEKTSFVT